MLKEIRIFLGGHNVKVKSLGQEWKQYVDENPINIKHDPARDIATSFITNGVAALLAAEGQRNMMAGRLAELRRKHFQQNQPIGTGDPPMNTGTIKGLSNSILSNDEEARAIARHFKLKYHPIRPREGVPVNMTHLNTAIWAMRSAFAAGGVYLGEYIVSQFQPYVKDFSYALPYVAIATAAIPLAFTVGNALRSIYALSKDRKVSTFKATSK